MTTHEQLELLLDQADAAINAEDFVALMRFYADEATLVVKPGKTITGHEALRNAFVFIADFFNHTLQVSQEGLTVVEGAETALVLARTRVRATMKTGEPYDVLRRATYVFKRDATRGWLCTVDNSYGTDLLDEAPRDLRLVI